MESKEVGLERGRTSGDGMEEEKDVLKDEEGMFENDLSRHVLRRVTNANVQETVHRKGSACSTTNTNNLLPLPGSRSLYRRTELMTRSLAPIIPKGKLIQLIPRLVVTSASTRNRNTSTCPKFIPYEPYSGAISKLVTPTISLRSIVSKKLKINKNNLDIGVLVSQMSIIRTQELDNKSCEKMKDSNIKEAKIDKLKDELRTVREERDYYQGQFKFQTQVNSELKNLLIASVGEDLQTHVNVLTEDKLQLARALLDTANNLTTHTEQIEFLASQCEVWRSKFLASSVMVEELARWKADLTQKNLMLNESTKRLLHTTHQIRDMQLELLRNLKFIAKMRYLNVPATDVISLSAENLNITQQIVLHSGVGIPEQSLDILTANKNVLCSAENYAVQSLQFVSQPLISTDDAIKALFGQAKRPCGLLSKNERGKVEAVDENT